MSQRTPKRLKTHINESKNTLINQTTPKRLKKPYKWVKEHLN